MNRVSLFVTTTCIFGLSSFASHAQFATPDTSHTGDPASNAFVQQGTSVFSPSSDQIRNSGLGVRILFVGRNEDGKTLTISIELQNVSKDSVYIALVGPQPAAIDTSGVTYKLTETAGLAQCQSLENRRIADCIKNAVVGGSGSGYLPGSVFSLLQPGASAIVATTFTANKVSTSGQASKPGFLSVTMNVALAKGSRPKDKRGEDDKIENVAISFPLVALREVK